MFIIRRRSYKFSELGRDQRSLLMLLPGRLQSQNILVQCSIFVASFRTSVLFYQAVKERVPFPHICQPTTGIVSVNAINAATIKGCIMWTCKVAERPFLKLWNLFPSFYARHNLECLLRVSFWGSRVSLSFFFFFTAPRQPVCMSPFLPTAWQVAVRPRRGAMYPELGLAPVVFTSHFTVMILSWERARCPSGAQWETCILIYIFICITIWYCISKTPATVAMLLKNPLNEW